MVLQMSEIIGFNNIVNSIKNTLLQEEKDILLFAFNATGKTRLSRGLDSVQEECLLSLCYNAIIEDYFTWNNDDNVLNIAKNNWFFNFIKEEELDGEIQHNFSEFTNEKIEPQLDVDSGQVKFNLVSGDDKSQKYVKISKGEETLFKWTVFFTVLQRAVALLCEKEENRSTNLFNNLNYVIIDDPISSLDDYRIYTLSMQILGLIREVHERNIQIRFLISTHHVMFYNILSNSLRNRGDKQKFYLLLKQNNDISLKCLNSSDIPLTYHIELLKDIKKALEQNEVQKYHFNIFRSVLEKMTIVLGYGCWQSLFEQFKNKDDLNKIVNMNSHERYADIETKYLTQEQINLFKEGFEYFVSTYKIKL